MKKQYVLKVQGYVIITLTSLFLISCASTTGPVTIRDSSTAPTYSQGQKSIDSKRVEQVDIAVLSPVRPDMQKTAVPIIDKLVRQADQQLLATDYKKAINTAERGLRIDRKEPRLYLALAKAYRGLQNTQQSSYFATQGLRYANKGDSVFIPLSNLSY